MSRLFQIVSWSLLSYLLGCVNGAYYLYRRRTGADIRVAGTGNPGARNAARVMGWRSAALVFLVDCAKGVLAVAVAVLAGLGAPGAFAAAFAVILGHIFPVQLGFRGGKGIATTLGAFVVLDPLVALAGLTVAALLLLITGRAAMSGAVAVVVAPLLAFILGRTPYAIGWYGLIALLAVIAHHADFAGLWRRAA